MFGVYIQKMFKIYSNSLALIIFKEIMKKMAELPKHGVRILVFLTKVEFSVLCYVCYNAHQLHFKSDHVALFDLVKLVGEVRSKLKNHHEGNFKVLYTKY